MVVTTTAPSAIVTLEQLDDLYQRIKTAFSQKYGQTQTWAMAHGLSPENVKNTLQQAAAVGTLMTSVALGKPVENQVLEQLKTQNDPAHQRLLAEAAQDEHQAVLEKMKAFVQRPAGHLEKAEELYLEQQLSDMLGFEVSAELEGKRLNHALGIMGGEQHLRRYPTDALSQHDAYQEAGIAPNRGAFGWFTEDGQLTPDAVLKEKYYFAVQTLYLADWNSNHAELKPWYKFRKMIVINPQEEVAVVGVVGDAGPAQWVQKQFGGSPEVIREGKIWSAKSRGHVILLFVDDPQNKVPLGPISLSLAQTLAQK